MGENQCIVLSHEQGFYITVLTPRVKAHHRRRQWNTAIAGGLQEQEETVSSRHDNNRVFLDSPRWQIPCMTNTRTWGRYLDACHRAWRPTFGSPGLCKLGIAFLVCSPNSGGQSQAAPRTCCLSSLDKKQTSGSASEKKNDRLWVLFFKVLIWILLLK